jgi:predicted nucleic acid binding AN1-type Zn finger protein
MQIFVKIPSGEVVSLEVEANSTIAEVKQKLSEKRKQDQIDKEREKEKGNEKNEKEKSEVASPSPPSRKRSIISEKDDECLIFDGKKLVDTSTVEECNISQNSTINLHINPSSQKKSKCSFGDCVRRPVLIVGNCKFCTKDFCAQHRLPETHACPNMKDCRQQSFDRNKAKLMKEKCVAAKV